MTTQEFKPPQEIQDLMVACDMVNEVYGLLDQAEIEIEQTAGHICVEKCGKCCEHNTPVVTMVEVANIVSYIGNFKDTKPYVANSLSWLETKLKDADSRGVIDQNQLAQEVAITQTMQCPFLDSDKGCAIWPVRPLVCRTYGVTVPADDWCPAPGDNARISRNGYLIARDTDLGKRIAGAKTRLFKFIHGKIPDKAMVGFLPMMLTQVLATRQYNWLVQNRRVSDAKLAQGVSSPDLFWDRIQAPVTSDELPLKESSVTLAGDYNFRENLSS